MNSVMTVGTLVQQEGREQHLTRNSFLVPNVVQISSRFKITRSAISVVVGGVRLWF